MNGTASDGSKFSGTKCVRCTGSVGASHGSWLKKIVDDTGVKWCAWPN